MNKIVDCICPQSLYFSVIILTVSILTVGLVGCGDDDDQKSLDELEQQIAVLQQENQNLRNTATSQPATNTLETVQIDTYGDLVATSAWSISYEIEQWIALRIQDIESWARSGEVVNAGQGPLQAEKARKYLGDEIINIADVEDAYIVGLSGELITDEIGYTEPELEAENAAWRMGMENKLYVGGLYLPRSGFSSHYRMDVAVLIEDITTSNPMGVLVCTIQLYPSSLGQEYESRFSDVKILVFDNTGRLIMDSDDDKRYLEQAPVWNSLEQQLMGKITSDTTYISPDFIVNDSVVAGYARASNESVDTRISGFEGLGWTVMFIDEVEVLECNNSQSR